MITDKKITPDIEHCLTFVQFDDYAKGRLAPEEMEALRQHMEKCPDCRDIYEALKELDEEYLTEAITELDTRIDSRAEAIRTEDTVEDKRPAKGSVIKAVFKYAAAAAVAGLCIWGASRFVADNAHPGGTVADDVENTGQPQNGIRRHHGEASPIAEPRQSGEPEDDITSIGSVIQASPNITLGAQQETVGQQPENSPAAVPADMQKPQADPGAARETKPAQAEQAKKTEEKPRQDNGSAAAGEEMITRGIDIPGSGEPAKVVNAEKVEKLMADADKYYSEHNYTVAKAVLERIMDEDPGNNEALRMLALCDYNLKNYGQSLRNLRRVKPKDEMDKRELEDYIDECIRHINY